MDTPIVLIHGAWQGAWTFDALRTRLDTADISSIAIDLAGNGFDDTAPDKVDLELYISQVGDAIDELGGRAAILGHSGGGIVATAAAERLPAKTAAVIYLAGMCLPTGIDFGELQTRVAGVGNVFGVSGDIVVSDDGLTSTVSPQAALTYFLDDIPEPIASQAAARLTPQPEGGRLISSPTTPENFGQLPKLYIEALQDSSMIIEAQRAMQAFIPEMPVVSMDCGHVPQVADPERLTEILADFLGGL